MVQSGGPGEDIVLSGEMRWTLSPWSVDGLVLWVSCLFLGVTGALSSLRGVQQGRDGHVLGSLRLGSWGGPLRPTCSQASVTPARHPLQELGTRTCPVKRGAWVGGLVGPVSDGHTQVWGWVWWPAATRRSHHAAAAPFWGLRCPRGGWVRGGGRRDRDVWDGGPGPWVPPQEEWASCPEGRRPVTVLGVSKHRAAPRPAGRPGVGFLQTRHRTPDGGRGWDRGRFLSGLEPEVKVLGARSSAGSGVSRSQATPSPVSVSAITSPSPPCVWVQMPPMRTLAHRSVTSSHPGQLCGGPSAHKVPF